MATEDELRDAQKQYLADEVAMAKAKAWTPSLVDVSRLVIEVLNDKYSSTTSRNVGAAVAEVMVIMRLVNKELSAPGMWAQPSAAPLANVPDA